MVLLPVWLTLIFGATALFLCKFVIGIGDADKYVFVVGAFGALGYCTGIWIKGRRQ